MLACTICINTSVVGADILDMPICPFQERVPCMEASDPVSSISSSVRGNELGISSTTTIAGETPPLSMTSPLRHHTSSEQQVISEFQSARKSRPTIFKLIRTMLTKIRKNLTWIESPPERHEFEDLIETPTHTPPLNCHSKHKSTHLARSRSRIEKICSCDSVTGDPKATLLSSRSIGRTFQRGPSVSAARDNTPSQVSSMIVAQSPTTANKQLRRSLVEGSSLSSTTRASLCEDHVVVLNQISAITEPHSSFSWPDATKSGLQKRHYAGMMTVDGKGRPSRTSLSSLSSNTINTPCALKGEINDPIVLSAMPPHSRTAAVVEHANCTNGHPCKQLPQCLDHGGSTPTVCIMATSASSFSDNVSTKCRHSLTPNLRFYHGNKGTSSHSITEK
jgi:hypothetical protein